MGFGVNGLMGQRSEEVVVVNMIEPEARTTGLSNQVPWGLHRRDGSEVGLW